MTDAKKLEWAIKFAKAMGWTSCYSRTYHIKCGDYPWYHQDETYARLLFVKRSEDRGWATWNPWTNPADALELANEVFEDWGHERLTHGYAEPRHYFVGEQFSRTDDGDEEVVEYPGRADNGCEAICLAVKACLEAQEKATP